MTETFTAFVSAAPAVTTPAGNELIPLITGGVTKSTTLANALAAASITRAAIASATSLPPTLMVSGYATAGDLGVGAIYTSQGATSGGLEAIQDAGGTWYNLVLSGIANVGWFGAKGNNNGTPGNGTDDSAAFQAALNACAAVYVPPVNFRIASTLTLNSGNSLFGPTPWNEVSSGFAQLVGDTGITILAPYNNTSSSETSGLSIYNLAVTGGLIGLQLTPVALLPATSSSSYVVTMIKVTDAYFSQSGTGSCNIVCSTQMERNVFRNLDLAGADYGFRFIANGNTSFNYFDKNTWSNINVQGANISGFYLAASRTCNANVFENLRLQRVGQNAFVMDAPALNTTIINPIVEQVGSSQTNQVFTTGTISSGSNSLVVASVTGLAVGMQLTIAGAGPSGTDLVAFIQSTWNGSSTTIPLVTTSGGSTAANASESITSLEVTNALYDEFSFLNDNGNPENITFIGGELGISTSRYAINISAYFVQIYNMVGIQSRGIVYDPNWACVLSGGSMFARTGLQFPSYGKLSSSNGGILYASAAQNPRRDGLFLIDATGALYWQNYAGTVTAITIP
jgi:hypothetical protein